MRAYTLTSKYYLHLLFFVGLTRKKKVLLTPTTYSHWHFFFFFFLFGVSWHHVVDAYTSNPKLQITSFKFRKPQIQSQHSKTKTKIKTTTTNKLKLSINSSILTKSNLKKSILHHYHTPTSVKSPISNTINRIREPFTITFHTLTKYTKIFSHFSHIKKQKNKTQKQTHFSNLSQIHFQKTKNTKKKIKKQNQTHLPKHKNKPNPENQNTQMVMMGAEKRWLFSLFIAALLSLLLLLLLTSLSTFTSPKPFPSTIHHGSHYPPSFAYFITGNSNDGDRILRLLLAVYHPRNRYLLHLSAESADEERRRLVSQLKSVPAIRVFGNVDVVGKSDRVTFMGASKIAITLRAAAMLLRLDGGWNWFVTLSAQDYPLVTQDGNMPNLPIR